MAIAKISSNAGELALEDVFSRGAIYQIPLFQRPYKWKPKTVLGLYKDFLVLAEEGSEVHFLGATILHGLPNDPAKAAVFQVIDGQQRLTTSFLFIAGIVKTLLVQGEVESAASLFSKYMRCNGINDVSSATLHPARQDQDSMHFVLKDIVTAELQLALPGVVFKNFRLPDDEAAAKRGIPFKNYKQIVKLLDHLYEEQGKEFFLTFYSRMLQRTTLVSIVVDDMATGPVIYDRLNSGQEPMTIGDLVKNEIFNKVEGANLAAAEELDRNFWKPFYRKFQHENTNYFDAYFFPFGLIWNANLKKSEVYESLRKRWQAMKAEEIIQDLTAYQSDFMDLVVGGNSVGHSQDLKNQVVRLRQAGIPASTLPFLMQVSRKVSELPGEYEESSAIEILKLVEDFLVRRAIIGIEPTGLHAVFKRLWQDLEGEFSVDAVRKAINQHVTVTVPTDEQVKTALETRRIYQSGITGYLLKQFDVSLKGDRHDVPFWIEHVYPQNPKVGEWKSFTGQEHLLHVVGNLVLLSEEMNRDASNLEYSEKRAKIRSKSVFLSARELVDKNKSWGPEQVVARSKEFASWAIRRWKY